MDSRNQRRENPRFWRQLGLLTVKGRTGIVVHNAISRFDGRAAIIAVMLVASTCSAVAQQRTNISKADVQAVLDSIDRAMLKKDAAAVVANCASNAVIASTIFESGDKGVSTRRRDDYEKV